MTKFFEPISLSATHIYHSILELCPISSTVRRLYYRQRRPFTPRPRVVIGAPDSWDQSVSISNKDYEYGFCIWSPCGRFVAVQTAESVEIRDQLTFELLTTLQLTETMQRFKGPLAYSPDGRSIVCGSDTSVGIWDIQTGGVINEIRCGLESISVVWSLDGRTVGFIDSNKRVRTHDLASGRTITPGEFSSTSDPYFWAHKKSFWIFTTVPSDGGLEATAEVLEVGHILTKIHSIDFPWGASTWPQPNPNISYSPTTCHFAISTNHSLHVFKGGSSIIEPLKGESIFSHCFSPDGSLFAAVTGERIRVWKYSSPLYEPWKELWCPGQAECLLQFSPNQSPILGSFGSILRSWRLHDLPATPQITRRQFASLSRSGDFVAIAHKLETIIGIVDFHSPTPSSLIDTVLRIEGLAFTGNVLLVFGSGTITAWLLTEEGLTGTRALSGNVTCPNPHWAVSLAGFRNEPEVKVESHVGTINLVDRGLSGCFVYHTETGEILRPDPVHQQLSSSRRQFEQLSGRDYPGFHSLPQSNDPPEGGWQTSEVTVREGWVKDPEGRCRLWVPVEWRADWDLADWRHEIATQFSILDGKCVVIKF